MSNKDYKYDKDMPWTDSNVAAIKQRIKDGYASHEEVMEVMADIREHMKDPCATISNYNGVFGNSIIRSICDNYPEILNDDAISAAEDYRIKQIATKVYDCIVKNERVNIHPNLVKFVVSYFKNRDSDTSSDGETQNVVVVGYKETKDGRITVPQKRNSNDPVEK